MDTVTQVKIHAPGEIRLDRDPMPEPGPRDVLVRVAACGICGSDVGYVRLGGVAGPSRTPMPIGHELSGVVEAVGAEVTGVAKGTRVVVDPLGSGNNIGVWRTDYERVNGFDERFVGWGLEDKDFQRRLARYGVRTMLTRTKVYHLWHPKHATYSHKGRGTPNYDYFYNSEVVARCENGLSERSRAGYTCKVFDTAVASEVEAGREAKVFGGPRTDGRS